MIAADFARVRVLATESIATPMVEGARARGQKTGEGAASAVRDRDRARKWISRMGSQSHFGCSLSGLVQYAG